MDHSETDEPGEGFIHQFLQGSDLPFSQPVAEILLVSFISDSFLCFSRRFSLESGLPG
jgi:hypothetical protein